MSTSIHLFRPVFTYRGSVVYAIGTLKSPHFEGTYTIQGGQVATLMNIPGSYFSHFDFQTLRGLQAQDSISLLEEQIEKLGKIPSDNPWDVSPGNVGYTCAVLLDWAVLYPKGIWAVGLDCADCTIYHGMGVKTPSNTALRKWRTICRATGKRFVWPDRIIKF